MFEAILKDFVFIWTVIDPVGSIPVFISATVGREPKAKRKIAFKAVNIFDDPTIFFLCSSPMLHC